jgi:hypothetical protein
MPNLPISSLPELTGMTPNAEFAVEQAGTTYKVKNSVLTPFPTAYGVFAQTGDSVTITATNVESSLIGPGVGTLSVPANTFKIGDSFQVSMDGLISCVNTATIDIRVRTTGNVLLTNSGVVDLDTSTSKSFILTLFFTIRQIGGTTVASISSGGLFSYISDSGLTYEGHVLSYINDIDFDTTVLNTLNITAQFNTNNAGNSIFSRNCTLTKIF